MLQKFGTKNNLWIMLNRFLIKEKLEFQILKTEYLFQQRR
jgi:hypothetical protein